MAVPAVARRVQSGMRRVPATFILRLSLAFMPALVVGCSGIEAPEKSPVMNAQTDRAPVDTLLHLAGRDVIRYTRSPYFTETSRSIVQGRRDNNGSCLMNDRITLQPGDTLTEELTELDPATCKFLISRGDYSTPLVQTASSEGDSTEVYGDTIPTGGPDVFNAKQRLWLTDPIGVNVNEDDNITTWASDYSCILAVRMTNFMQWDVSSSWYRTWVHGGTFPSVSCSTVEGRTFAEFENDKFSDNWWAPCLSGSTWADYLDNIITVDLDGAATFEATWKANGNCSYLLTKYRQAFVGGSRVI